MRLLALITVVLLTAGLGLGGSAALGRILLAVGQPGLAADVFNAPEWRGVAYYRDGSFEAAATEFAEARQFFNLGNAQVHAGNYAEALEAYDLAIVRGDAQAKANFDVVAAFYAGLGIDPESLALFPQRKHGATAEAEVGEGDGRAAGTGDGVTNTNTMLGLAQLETHGEQSVRRVFKDYFMVADDRWLLHLEDVPGEFMAERILQEYKRRAKLGLTPPDPEDPQ